MQYYGLHIIKNFIKIFCFIKIFATFAIAYTCALANETVPIKSMDKQMFRGNMRVTNLN